MGRLTLLLDKDKKERLTVPVYLTEDKVKEVDNFLTDNKKSLESSYVDILSNYLIQMNGYFNQLMVRGEGLTSKEEQTKYKEKANLLEEKKNNKTRENLEEVTRGYFNLYNVRKDDMDNYDFVIDSTDKTPLEVKELILLEYNNWLRERD